MDALVFAVVMIVQMQGNVEVGTATGFFYAAEDGRTFLVTNRHVVEPKLFRVDALKLRVHTDVNDLAKNIEVTLKLFDGGKPRYLVPRKDPKGAIDLAAVPLRKDEMSSAAIKVFTRKDAPPPKLTLGYGTPVLVIGYPRSFHDEKHNAPIARQGGLASAYPLDFNGQPYFLVDANLHKGTSGGPVMSVPSSVLSFSAASAADPAVSFMNKPVSFLLGVNSESLSADLGSTKESLGLAKVFYPWLIEDLVSQAR